MPPTDELPTPPATESTDRYTPGDELNALRRFTRQIPRLSPGGRQWLANYLAEYETDVH